MFAVVQLDPGVPAVAVQRQAVPLVQQYRLFRPNYSKAGTTIEPVKHTEVIKRLEKSGEGETRGLKAVVLWFQVRF
jgi:hypothetical protein